MKEIYEDNKQLKGKIRDLLDENREQKKINSQFKKEITEIKTLLKSSEFKELFKLKSTFLKSKTVADKDWHLNEDNKSVKTIGTNSFKSGINQKAEAVNTSGRTSSKRQLLTSIFFLLCFMFLDKYLYYFLPKQRLLNFYLLKLLNISVHSID